jgi:hypothetical protein
VSQYYYFVATLPRLAFDGPAPMSVTRFLEECRRLMSPHDYEAVMQANLSSREAPQAGVSAAGQYFATDRQLRNTLVELRAQRLGWDAMRFFRSELESAAEPTVTTAKTAQAARSALDAESPKTGELQLLQYRWALIDQLETNHHFDVVRLICYHLKLQLLERKNKFDKETGREVFQRTVDAISAPLEEWRQHEDETE